MPLPEIGAMREELVLQTSAPIPLAIAGLTAAAGTATAVFATAHGFANGDYVTIAGASEAGYLGLVPIALLGATSFSYAVPLDTPAAASGAPTATYVSDALGGAEKRWRTLDTIWGALVLSSIPTSPERIMATAVQGQTIRRFAVYARDDIGIDMRVLWTRSSGTRARTLNITMVTPIEDGRDFMAIETSEPAAA